MMIQGQTRQRLFRLLVTYGSVLLVLIWIIAPFYWLVISSISPPSDLLATPPHWIPHQPTFKNYVAIVKQGLGLATGALVAKHVLPALENSTIIAVAVTISNIILATPAGYAFARYRFPFKNSILYTFLATKMIPGFAIIIPFFIIFRTLQLIDSKTGIIITHVTLTLPFSVWIIKGYFEGVPIDLERAARADGCSRIQTLMRITLPLSLPGLVATAVYAFMTSWNEFLFALILTSTPKAQTIQPAIAAFTYPLEIDYGLAMAASVLGALPPVLITLFFQRYLVQGLLSGAIKG